MFKRGARGFSLVELIMAAVIMTVVGAFGLYSLAGGRKSTQSRGMAEEIAEELKAARQQAISKQVAVGVGFPSSNGGTGCSQSFYLLEGVSTPRMTRSVNYSSTYRESCFFWGAWGGGIPEVPVLSESEVEFELATWQPLPNLTDYLLVFTPQGTVVSNGLPVFPGREYRLLVSNGVSETGGGGLKTPASVSKPYTVRIAKSGAVTVTPGVIGATIAEAPSLAVSASNSVPAATAPTGVPQIEELRAEPLPEEDSDGGAYTIVPDEGYITLIAEATDPSGGPLTTEWRATGPKGSGRFSSEEPMSMTWEPKHESGPRWTARTNWTPPPSAVHGEIYALNCTVRNPRGGSITQQLGSSASIEVVRPHKVAIVNTDESWERFYVAWLNPEGTNVISVTLPDFLWEQRTPVWNPNGTKLAFYQIKENDTLPDVWDARLYVVNDDGTGLSNKFTCWGDFADYSFGPSFSPDGSQIAFSSFEQDDFRNARVWRCSVFGNKIKQRLTTETAPAGQYTDHTDVSWNPVYQNWILYTGTRYDEGTDEYKWSSIRVCDVNAANSRDLVLEPGPTAGIEGPWEDAIGESHWSFDGKKVVYTRGGELFYIGFNPANGFPGTPAAPVNITPNISGFYATMPRFSPDDNQVAVVDDYGALYVVESLTTNPPYHLVANPGEYGMDGYNWSPDGLEFCYAAYDEDGYEEGQIFTVPATGGSPKNVTPPGFLVWSAPSWWAP